MVTFILAKFNRAFLLLAMVCVLIFPGHSLRAQGTAFTYNGSFSDDTNPASGYYDLIFTLFNSATNGTSYGAVTNLATPVSNGLFTVPLDFGSVFNGSNYWLELAARTNGAPNFITLSPRQAITPTPYAIYAGSAGTAASANAVAGTNITGTVPLKQLPGSVMTNFQTGVNLGGGFTGSFTGNGVGLTNVPAAAVTGTLPDSQLSTNMARLNQANTFGNASNVFVGSFTGSGGGLTNLSASGLSGLLPLADLPSGVVTNYSSPVFSSVFFSNNIAAGFSINDGAWTSFPIPFFEPMVTNQTGVLDVYSSGASSPASIDIGTPYNYFPNGQFLTLGSLPGQYVDIIGRGLGTNAGVPLVLQGPTGAFNGGNLNQTLGFFSLPDESVSVVDTVNGVNGGAGLDVINEATGPTSFAKIVVKGIYGSSSDGVELNAFSAFYTPNGAFLPNSVALKAQTDETNGLTLVTKAPTAPIRFFVGGFSAANNTVNFTTNSVAFFVPIAASSVSATNYFGNGGGLTNLPAAGLSGTLADSLLSPNIPRLNQASVFANSSNVFVGTFTGNGAGLTNIQGVGMTGPVADSQLSTNVALMNQANTFNNPGNYFAGTFSGNGSGLTNLPPAVVTGAVADSQLSTNVAKLILPGNAAVPASATITVNSGFVVGVTIISGGAGYATPPQVTLTDVSGSNAVITASIANGAVTGLTVQSAGSGYSGNGTALIIAPPPSNVYQTFTSGNIFNGVSLFNNPGSEFTGAFTGNGSGLTNLSASILTGTMADLQLSTNIPRLNQANAFANPSNVFVGSFIGDGSGLTNLPIAVLTGTNGGVLSILAQLSAANAFSNPGNTFVGTFTGSGGGLTNLSAASLTGTIADSQLSTNIARLNLPGNGAVPATASVVMVSGFVVGAAIINGGAGYTTSPLVTVTDVSGSNAVITATVSNGVVASLTVESAGRAYSAGTSLSIAPPPSSAFQTFTGGTIFNGVARFNNPASTYVGSFAGNGAGLTNLPLANLTGTISDSQLSPNIVRLNVPDTSVPATAGPIIVSGYIVGATITNGGAGYLTAPAVSVVDVSGSNAVLTATVANGTVTGLTVQVAGSGYSSATALVVAPPPDNSVQTFASSLIFNGSETFNNSSNIFTGSFVGNGLGLTNVNAAQLSGTISLGNLPGVLVTNLGTPTFNSIYFTNNGASNFFIGDGTWAPEPVPYIEPAMANQSGVLDVLSSSPTRPAWIDIGSPYNFSQNGQFLSLGSVPGQYANIMGKGLGGTGGYPLIIQGPGYAPNSGTLSQNVGFFDLPDDAVSIQLKVNAGQGLDVVNNSGPNGYARLLVKNLSGSTTDGLELDSFYTNFASIGAFQSNSVAIQSYKTNGLEIITRQTNAPIGFYIGGFSLTNNTFTLAPNLATFNVPVAGPTFTAGSFVGDGSGLTNLSLPNFTLPVPDAVLSGNIARLNPGNTAVTATAGATVNAGMIVGTTVLNGGTGYITAPLVTVADISGSNAVITATVANGAVSGLMIQNSGSGYSASPLLTISAPPANYSQTFSGANNFTGANTFSNPSNTFMGAFIGDGSGLTNLPLVVLTGTNGTGVLSTLAQLSAANNFTNPSNTFTGTFIGNGAGLTGLTLTNFNIFSNLVAQINGGTGLTATISTNGNGTLVYSLSLAPGWLTNNAALPVNLLNGVIVAGGTNPAGGTYAVTNPFIMEANNSSVAGPIITPVNPNQVVMLGLQPAPGAVDSGSGLAQLDIFNTNTTGGYLLATNPVAWVSLGVSSNSAFIATRSANGGPGLPLTITTAGSTNGISLQTNGTLTLGGYYAPGGALQVVKSSVMGNESAGISIYGANATAVNVPELLFGVVTNTSGLGFIQTAEKGTAWAGTLALQTLGGRVGIGTTNPAAALGVAGSAVISGNVTAAGFLGSGSGLTNLPAANLTGAVADSLLSTNIPRLNLSNTSVQATAGVTEVGGLVVATTITNGGSGYGTAPLVTVTDATGSNAVVTATVTNGVVTALKITAAGSGYSPNLTLTISAPPASPSFQTFSGANNFTGANTFSNSSNNFAGTFSGNGSGLTGISAGAITGGISTNILIGGHTFFITNGLIMNIQ